MTSEVRDYLLKLVERSMADIEEQADRIVSRNTTRRVTERILDKLDDRMRVAEQAHSDLSAYSSS